MRSRKHLSLDTFALQALSLDDIDCDPAIVAGRFAFGLDRSGGTVGGKFAVTAGPAVYVVAVVVAAVADGMSHSPFRAMPTALLEAVPALSLAVAALRVGSATTSRAGQICFVAAMVVLMGGVVFTSGTPAGGYAIGIGAVAAVGLLLAVAYLCSHIGNRADRRVAIGGTVVLLLVAALPASEAISAWVDTPKHCGVDDCAFTGLGIVFGFGIAGVLVLLATFAAALTVDKRAALGVLLFGVGVVLLAAVAPVWSQYQGVVGIIIGYAGLALAASPWLAAGD